MTKLFEPFVLGNLTLKNRIIMAGMHTEFGRDGYLTERELAYYEERAKGGAAAIGVVARVSPEGGPESMAGVYDNTFGAGVRCLAERLHQHDCRLFIHLFHIGRNHADDILGRPLLAPSAVPSPIYRHMPKEMTAEDIKRVKEDFADAAARCRAWGADGVAVNCSAGYLLSLFLSGETNQRTDEYGGSQENRFRFPLEVLARVREAVGRDFPVLVKISGSSMRTRGYGLKDMEAFSSKLSGLADAIGVTGGWHEAPVPQITYQVPRGFYSCLSSCIKEHSGLPVICYNRRRRSGYLRRKRRTWWPAGGPSWQMQALQQRSGTDIPIIPVWDATADAWTASSGTRKCAVSRTRNWAVSIRSCPPFRPRKAGCW